MKVQISVDDKLMERVDAYADENYMTRSGLITLACTQFLNQAETLKAIVDMSICLNKIAEKGTVDEDTMRELEDIERICRMLKP